MKKWMCALLAVLLLVMSCAGVAEQGEAADAEQNEAVDTEPAAENDAAEAEVPAVGTVACMLMENLNYVFEQTTGVSRLFSTVQEMSPGIMYGFGSGQCGIIALIMGDAATGKPMQASFVSSNSEELKLMQNMVCAMAMARKLTYPDEKDEDADTAAVMALADWLEAGYESVLNAMTNGEAYEERFTDAADHYVEFAVLPVEDGARAMVTYFFDVFAE